MLEAKMPTARESLLDAARTALEAERWSGVRMVQVAAAAGVSRQTLYNEFGDKTGLAAALLERQLNTFLHAIDDQMRRSADAPPGELLAALTDWILRAARGDQLVRTALTGCHCDGLPTPPQEPGQLVAELRARAVRALAHRTRREPGLPDRCETAVRLAVSHLVAPARPRCPGRPPAPSAVPAQQSPQPHETQQAQGTQAQQGQSPSRRSRVDSSRRNE
jgi:AcrR family transcriptional regulator